MKICLLGYGKMGREVERVALSRGHEIVGRIDEACDLLPPCDVVIEFTSPCTACANISNAVKQGLRVVSGTTGWLDQWAEVAKVVTDYDGTLFYASNFSIGIYLFRQVNKTLARMMNHYPSYEPSIEEIHHIHKLDYPSGTALSIANDMIDILDNKSESIAFLKGEESDSYSKNHLVISSIRSGEVPGTHTVRYESAEDVISLTHEAKGRAGLALGAVLAAEFVRDKRGIFGMEDLVQLDGE